MPPKADKAADPSIMEAIHALAESFNAQLLKLRSSHLELKNSLETKIESTLSDLHRKLDPASSSTPLSPADAFKGIMHRHRLLSDWENFTRAIEIRFGPSQFVNPQTALFKLKQTGMVAQYQQEFELLSNRVSALTDEHLLNLFISGLRYDIQQEVVILNPLSLTQAFALAKLQEVKLNDSRRGYRTPPLASSVPSPQFRTPALPSSSNTSKGPSSSTAVFPIRRFSPSKMQARRAKGLCFNYDENFQPGHRCKTTPFLLLQMDDETPETIDYEEATMTALSALPLPPDPLTTDSQEDEFRVSLHALYGITSQTCMQLTGHIKGHPVSVLIDSGSTHNLVQPRIIKYLGLPIEPAPTFSVRVGNDKFLQCDETLTEQQTDTNSFDSELSLLFTRYAAVFYPPKGLPPPRSHDHHIHLIPGSKPVNVKPYRYPHNQKRDMEVLISEMLQEGIIRPSTSPFSSPVLLVKKKDVTWRFRADYRALNAITIRDRFPIPTIDELLDKLHGASIFSKFDLRADYHQIRVMPFGLTNAPSTFQAAMNDLFRPHLRKFVLVFFDDILIYSCSKEEHYQHLQLVMELLLTHQFFAKRAKCSFAQSSIDYLGHIISSQGVQVDPSKITAIIDWPLPANIKALRGFLGLTGYYRKFVKHYATIVAPLTDLLKQKSYQWTTEASEAFEKLKQALTTTPILALPDFSQAFDVTTNASNVAVGAVLSQGNHPLAYFSKKLNSNLQNSSAYVREMYAITEAVKKLRQYLRCHNKVADELSRSWPAEAELQAISVMKESRVVIPENHPLQQTQLKEFHSTLTGGHAGVARTLARLAANFWWKGMRKAVQDFVSTCKVCQEVKYLTSKPQGLLAPLPIPSQVWRDLAMDFITNLPLSHGKSTIWVIVDRLSKYAHFVALPGNVTAPTLASVYAQEVGKLHGMPKNVVCDRDPLFMSNFWQELHKLQGTQLRMSSAYHPQTDGQSEVLNRCLETYLRSFTSEQPKNWVKILHWAEWSYNTAYHSAASMTPFQALYGHPPPTIPSYVAGTTTNAQLDNSLIERQQLLKQLKANLARAHNRMVMQADRKRQERQFAEGDWVLVKLQPYRQQSVVQRSNQKLAKRYFGPYKILKKIGSVAYKLQLPEGSRVHPVFHISLLKAFKGEIPTEPAALPTDCVAGQPVLEPEMILKSRQAKLHGKFHTQYLVKWQQLPTSEATWEWAQDIATNHPNFNLEDKVVIEEGCSNTNPPADEGGSSPREKRQLKKPKWMKDYLI
ncbi:reverse transcriptase [Corchorus capsularis]|uniref:Reverse transcriptase n=1 Tax=Corchorus capsularis TaxID=210143 RepID=A0A1R3GAG9_COCAP|nr:reverse transcriptase [Corchorus capsularis]